MIIRHKKLSFHCVASIILVVAFGLFCNFSAAAQMPEINDSLQNIIVKDTVTAVGTDSLQIDSLSNINSADTLKTAKTDSLSLKKPSGEALDAEIVYSASDSIVFFANGKVFLYGEGDMTYTSLNLKSDVVELSMDSSTIHAFSRLDSLGQRIAEPVFTEGDHSYNAREMTYNLKTKKGFIRQAVTQEGEGYIISDRTKKSSDDEFSMEGGKYTVCDNHDHPHFYMNVTKGKFKPGKHIVFGPSYMVVEDVPLPLALPFGFFPFMQDYSSGVLMPSFVDEMNRGFGLTNGGYYFALSDYIDLELRGDIYSKGTWAVRGSSSYLKKYKFSGSLGIEYREDISGEKDLGDYTKSTNFSVRWSHRQDQKANPNTTLSASVQFTTMGFNQSNIDNYARPEINSQATTSSSVSLQQRFPSIPSLNVSLNASVTQSMRDSTISLTLPSLNISYSRFYPFKRKKALGNERWYEKISMSYTGALTNSIRTKENKLLHSSLQKDWQNGMRHSIPITATFNLFKYINISPYVNYNERWSLQHTEQSWDKEAQKAVLDTVYKFSRSYDFNTGISASTKLYGFYVPLPFINKIFGGKIDRIRHVATPSVGFGYTPDFSESFWGMYGTYTQYLQDRNNPELYTENEVRYAYMSGSPGRGTNGSINFSLGNNIEMKTVNANDTTGKEPFKKISLIDNFSVSGSYNLAADSMNWSNFSTQLRIKITKSYTLSLSASFDPYMYGLNSAGRPVRVNKLRWNNGRFPKFLGTSTAQSITINNDTFKKLFGKKSSAEQTNTAAANSENGDDLEDENSLNSLNSGKSSNSAKPEADSNGYEKVEIPWNISISYSINYGNGSEFDYNKMEYRMIFTHNLSLSGSISLTSNWRISTSTSYDFRAKQFASAAVNVSRSLHCWSMSASFVPFGRYKSYSFHIGVNSSMLSDLKYDKQSSYGRGAIIWY